MSLMKMTILAFKSFDNPSDLVKPRIFTAMFNPPAYKVERTMVKDTQAASGSDSEANPTGSIQPSKMTFDFVIDGTGAGGQKRIVLAETRNFEQVVMPKKKEDASMPGPSLPADSVAGSAEQAPGDGAVVANKNPVELPKLLLLYGTFMFSCEIESFSVNYTLFDSSGVPLRATISATFSEVEPRGIGASMRDFLQGDSVGTVANVAGFLSNAFAQSQNIVASVKEARSRNLNSLREQVRV